MAVKAGTAIENNFSKGLLTEATGLNFPENAATDTDNCVFDQIGQVRRRLGIDVEEDAVAASWGSTGAITEYVWRTVAKSGLYTFLVLQLGASVSFYQLAASSSLSSGIEAFAVNLLSYSAPGASQIANDSCSFASGNGQLFITHPQCDPILVKYVEETRTITQTRILLQIRDFEGVEDNLAIDFQPLTLSPQHFYNLKNQGWNKPVNCV